jgi:hypothetical protein
MPLGKNWFNFVNLARAAAILLVLLAAVYLYFFSKP